jgi:hypothetical protein
VSAIYLLDRVTLRPGRLATCREALRESYLPGARRRGMEFVGSWCAPPVEVEGEPTELYLLWRLAGVGEFFAMRGQAAADPEVAAFWRELEALALGRERRVLGEAGLAP